MTKWLVLLRKEWLEMLRNYKLVWLPLSFLVLGASQPVTAYFMPDILASAGSLPEGAIIQIPTPEPFQVMANALQQFGVLGLLLLVLSGMGVVSGERASGTAAIILVKPVSYTSFITAKWTAFLCLAWIAFAAGFGGAWYYTYILFGPVGWGEIGRSALLFALWLGLIGTLTLLFSALLRSAAAAAFCALACGVVLNVSAGLGPFAKGWNPGRLPGLAAQALDVSVRPIGGSGGSVWWTAAVTLIVCFAALAASVQALKSRPSE